MILLLSVLPLEAERKCFLFLSRETLPGLLRFPFKRVMAETPGVKPEILMNSPPTKAAHTPFMV